MLHNMLQKELGDLHSDSISQIRTLLPIPKEHNYVCKFMLFKSLY